MKGCNYEVNERHARKVVSDESGKEIILDTSDTSLWQLLPIVNTVTIWVQGHGPSDQLEPKEVSSVLVSWELRRRENDRHAEAGIRLACVASGNLILLSNRGRPSHGFLFTGLWSRSWPGWPSLKLTSYLTGGLTGFLLNGRLAGNPTVSTRSTASSKKRGF
jgi:hypothetical protein